MRSERKFKCYVRILLALYILEILLGIAIAALCEYIEYFVGNHIFQIDNHEIMKVFLIVQMFGLHVSFYFCCGVPLVWIFSDVYTLHMAFLLKLWLVLSIETACSGVFIAWLFNDTTRNLVRHFETSLIDGIKLYVDDPQWMLIWDDLQYGHKCCGVHSYADWLNVTMVMSERNHEEDLLPFSCSKGNVPLQVILSELNIHTIGCFTVVSSKIEVMNVVMIALTVAIISLLVKFIFSESHDDQHNTKFWFNYRSVSSS